MILVKIELHSARTGRVTELGRMKIVNDGEGRDHSMHYDGEVLRRPRYLSATRTGRVEKHQRHAKTIWHLVAKMLDNMGYTK